MIKMTWRGWWKRVLMRLHLMKCPHIFGLKMREMRYLEFDGNWKVSSFGFWGGRLSINDDSVIHVKEGKVPHCALCGKKIAGMVGTIREQDFLACHYPATVMQLFNEPGKEMTYYCK
jgi:hypothetical protein